VLFGAWAIALTLALQNPANGFPASTDIWTDDKPFERVLHNLVHDVRTLPSIETLAIMSAGAAGALLVHPYDERVAQWAATTEYSSYSPLGDVLGEGWVQAAAALGTYGIGRLTKDRKITHIGSDLIRAQLLNGIITRGLKYSVERTRPNGGQHSFPSGHSSATFTTVAVLQNHFGWKVGVPAYAIATFIGWARFRDNSHWVSDVAFGSAIGLAVGRTIVVGHAPRSWQVVPTATKGGGAIFFIRH